MYVTESGKPRVRETGGSSAWKCFCIYLQDSDTDTGYKLLLDLLLFRLEIVL